MKSLRVLFACLMAIAVASCNARSTPGVVPAQAKPVNQTKHRHIALPKAKPHKRPMDATGALVDGGFESGGMTYWQQCGTGDIAPAVTTARAHSGSYAGLGGSETAEVNGDSGLCQQVTVPTGGQVTFWVYQGTNETSTTYADQEFDLLDSTGAIITNLYTTITNTNGWVQKTYDLSAYAGQTVWLFFDSWGGGSSGYYVYQYVDDVSWVSGGPTPTPGPTATPAPTPTPVPTSPPTPSGGPTPIATPANGGGNSTGSCGTSCGVQRWHIKTLGDAYVNTINWTPILGNVSDLTSAPVPANYDQYNDTTRYSPYETQAYRIRATLVGWKIESDHDYHIVIADINNPSDTMIIEPPDPTCSSACDGGFANYFQSVRSKLTACFGQPTTSFVNFQSGIVVDVTGVPEFDALHGQTGVAPNGIELHPLMSIDFISGAPAGC